ncbi:hypothetical protein ZEAMMB73_Zm00001d044014 [Zea mays]|jgi:hypothetical protein|uniref:C2H2-type domain-containing protein n=1 Tax=Zea mays TaxID=4577 RepID=A0A1D6NGZ7_MAIZE|nr:hypothetical protein ZEAMMB73_Zm00001d044014 [Zea mays]
MAGSSEDGRRRSLADLCDAAILGRWGVTGRRRRSGCWSKQAASSSSSAQSVQSMAVVVANPEIVLQPTPLPTIVTPNPSSPVHMEPATPSPSSVPIASTMTNVSNESSSSFAKPSPPTEAVTHLDVAPALPSPPPAEVHATSSVPPPPLPGPQNPNGYTCKLCGASFPTHQGLGGHMAAHKTRELAAVPCLRDAKPVKEHGCRTCGAVFLTGYKLGGHMRKHYTGPKIVPKKKPRLDDVVTVQLLPARTVEPAPRPVLLFGVDIGAGAQMPAAAQGEGSSATATQAPSEEPPAGEQQ